MTTKLQILCWRLNLINCIYQLTSPGKINLKFEDVNFKGKVIVKPRYMSICHADQRYYRGRRSREVLKKKLPMALIHECCGEVLEDYSNTFSIGTKVVLIPNVLSDISQEGIFENYQKGSGFRSSGIDGFMQEIIAMDSNRLVPFNDYYGNEKVFAITEMVSVAVHAVERFISNSHEKKERIAVFGDGNLGFLVSLVLKRILPNSKIVVIGRHEEKLAHFSFADRTFVDIPENFEFDHSFECTGGAGCSDAIDKIIKFINPQGTVVLLGVSEEKVPINTRNILEKGLTFVGASRSGFNDFVNAVKFLEEEKFNRRVCNLISVGSKVNFIDDIHRVFEEVLNVPFKLVFEWNM